MKYIKKFGLLRKGVILKSYLINNKDEDMTGNNVIANLTEENSLLKQEIAGLKHEISCLMKEISGL